MSWQATSWAKQTRGHRSQGDKLLLMILADYAHPDTWHAWPNQDQLARDCEMSHRSIVASLNALEQRGFITRLQRGNTYQPSMYLLNAGTQLGVSAKSVSADVAQTSVSEVDDTVYVKYTTSVSEVPVHTRNQEEPLEEPILSKGQKWLDVLSADPRWKPPANGWAEDIEAKYGEVVDLTMEAYKCHAWLQDTPKGRSRKNIRSTWMNWLSNAVSPKSHSSPKGARRVEVDNDLDRYRAGF